MRRVLFAILAVLWTTLAHAQTPITTYLCIWNGQPCSSANGNLVTAGNPLPVSGTLVPGTASAVYTETPLTVATGNTFQQALAANAGRKSCVLQNNSTHQGYAYFGTLASATLTNTIQVAANGGSVRCDTGTVVSLQQVSFTSTTTSDAWVVSEGN
jgi:hypothetical protein